jgi:hypothetical protein
MKGFEPSYNSFEDCRVIPYATRTSGSGVYYRALPLFRAIELLHPHARLVYHVQTTMPKQYLFRVPFNHREAY